MVIDFHVHAFNPKVAEKAVEKLQACSGITPFTRGTAEETIQRFDEWGIDKGVLLSVATKPSQQRVINDWCAQQDGGRFISFGGIHPDAEDYEREIAHIKELGLHGIKLHPDYQGFMIDDERMDKIYDAIERADLPVIFHSGYDCVSPDLIHSTPERALNMIKKHPKLKVILAHLGANMMWEQVRDVLAGVDGEVYFDTAFTSMCPDELMQAIVEKHGADRILFASDCPWDSSYLIKEKILRLNISEDNKDKILGGNAERLLGLK